MGLAGRKVKQRIPNDPRNLSWADDAAKFGQAYLAKMGWDPSKGLGASGEGRTRAISVDQKLDMLGIGMQHQRDANGLAWQQNRDFENLLKRLNGAAEGTTQEEDGIKGEMKGMFKRAEGEDREEVPEAKEEDEEERRRRKKERKSEKKRKAEEGEGHESKKKRKKSKDESGSEKKSSKKARKVEEEEDGGSTSDRAASVVPAVPIVAPTPVRAPPRTHRARIIAAKRLASRTPAALSEILGIPSSSLPATPAAPSPLSALTPSAPATPADAAADLQKLTTATQSVADYFKAKLAARARASRSATPVVKEEARDEEDDAPRMGLGAASRSRSAVFDERGSAQVGIEASSKFGAVFLAAQDAGRTKVEEAPATESVQAEGAEENEDEKSRRKRVKEERRKEKARRRKEREGEGGE